MLKSCITCRNSRRAARRRIRETNAIARGSRLSGRDVGPALLPTTSRQDQRHGGFDWTEDGRIAAMMQEPAHRLTDRWVDRAGLPLLLPLAALATAWPIGTAYGWVTGASLSRSHYSSLLADPRLQPFFLLGLLKPALRLLLLLGCGWLLGVQVAWTSTLLSVRRPAIMRAYGAICALLAIVFAWIAWWTVVYDHYSWNLWRHSTHTPGPGPSLVHWMSSPVEVWNHIEYLAQYGLGCWRFEFPDDGTPQGTLLWIKWSLEALLILGCCVLLATSRVKGRGFCKSCRKWMRPESALYLAHSKDISIRALRQFGLCSVNAVTPPERDGHRWLEIGRQRCPECRETSAYQIDAMVRTKVGRLRRAFWPLNWVHQRVLAPLRPGYNTRVLEAVVRLTLVDKVEGEALLRIESALAVHPLSRIARSKH